jgi:hypothetical protein
MRVYVEQRPYAVYAPGGGWQLLLLCWRRIQGAEGSTDRHLLGWVSSSARLLQRVEEKEAPWLRHERRPLLLVDLEAWLWDRVEHPFTARNRCANMVDLQAGRAVMVSDTLAVRPRAGLLALLMQLKTRYQVYYLCTRDRLAESRAAFAALAALPAYVSVGALLDERLIFTGPPTQRYLADYVGPLCLYSPPSGGGPRTLRAHVLVLDHPQRWDLDTRTQVIAPPAPQHLYDLRLMHLEALLTGARADYGALITDVGRGLEVEKLLLVKAAVRSACSLVTKRCVRGKQGGIWWC